MKITIIAILFTLIGCKSFQQSSLEKSDNEIIAAYALCIRSMSDATTEVSGKNVSFCNEFIVMIGKEREFDKCVQAGIEIKSCYKTIYNRVGIQ